MSYNRYGRITKVIKLQFDNNCILLKTIYGKVPDYRPPLVSQ